MFTSGTVYIEPVRRRSRERRLDAGTLSQPSWEVTRIGPTQVETRRR
jgi:hypothetical protein